MNTLHQAIQDYLTMRCDLGFKLREAGDGLLEFAAFMRRRRAAYITSELALAWAQQPRDATPAHWAQVPEGWVANAHRGTSGDAVPQAERS